MGNIEQSKLPAHTEEEHRESADLSVEVSSDGKIAYLDVHGGSNGEQVGSVGEEKEAVHSGLAESGVSIEERAYPPMGEDKDSEHGHIQRLYEALEKEFEQKAREKAHQSFEMHTPRKIYAPQYGYPPKELPPYPRGMITGDNRAWRRVQGSILSQAGRKPLDIYAGETGIIDDMQAEQFPEAESLGNANKTIPVPEEQVLPSPEEHASAPEQSSSQVDSAAEAVESIPPSPSAHRPKIIEGEANRVAEETLSPAAEARPEQASPEEGEAESSERRAAEGAREQAAIEKELEQAPPTLRERIIRGTYKFGYAVEKAKDDVFAGSFGWVASQFEKRSTAGRFFSSLAEQFERSGQGAAKSMDMVDTLRDADQRISMGHKIGNLGFFAGNVLKYGRIITDAVGGVAMAPMRGFMLGSMAAASGLEAAKEARLKNEEVMDKTRITDIDKAAEEAWSIYRAAAEKADKNEGPVSAEDLKREYTQRIPKDILDRLAKDPQPGTGIGILQRVMKWDMERTVRKLQNELDHIDANSALSSGEKEAKKNALLQDGIFTKKKQMLDDFDRMVSQQGAVDTLARLSRYGEKGAKAAVYAVMADSIYKLWNHLGDALSNSATAESMAVSPAGLTQEGIESPVLPEELVAPQEEADLKALHDYMAAGSPEEKAEIARIVGASTEEMDAKAAQFSAEHAAGIAGVDAARAAAEAEATVSTYPTEHVIQPGENLWKAATAELEQRGILNGLNESQRTYVIDAVKDWYAAEHPDMNIDRLNAGDVVNLEILNNQDKMTEILGKVGALSPEQMENILHNNNLIAEWHHMHPDAPLTQDVVNEILNPKAVDATMDFVPSTTMEHEGYILNMPDSEGRSIGELHEEAARLDWEVRIDDSVKQQVSEVYGSKGVFNSGFLSTEGTRSIDWNDIKGRSVAEVFDKKDFTTTDPFMSGEEGAATKFGMDSPYAVEKAQKYLHALEAQSGAKPFAGEKVEEFVRRANEELAKTGKGFIAPRY